MAGQRKKVMAGALVLALPLALAACGGDSGGDGGGGGDGDTLTIWHYENDDSAMGQAWAKAIEIFEDENPDVTVTVENQTFEQIQKNAKIFLTGDDVPDVMEYNKGNATAGQLASQGLLTPLTDEAESRGWADTLPASIQTTATYDEQGLMGSGDWYGVPNYGEFVGVYYNQDMLDQYGLAVPTTFDEFENVLKTFKDNGVTPIATAGSEYPMGQLWYELVLHYADRDLIDQYQLFTEDVDFHDAAFQQATEKLDEWIKAGYVAADSAALTAEDMGVSFINGTYPLMVSGSWWFGRLVEEIPFTWGQALFPENAMHPGSSGNLWVVPENAANKDLAYEFIDITMRPEIQAIIGNNGGLPVAADPADITDEKSQELISVFNGILDADGLSFYPDWPAPGFYDVIVQELQGLITGAQDAATTNKNLGEQYDEGTAEYR
jgi:raffinose/stachyose/melibiose transport system substrate-binding protein